MALDGQRRQQLIDDLARRIDGAGMTAPAILFLETYRPLAFLGAQFLWIAQPFLSLAFGATDLRDFTLLVQDHAGVEALIDRLASAPAEDSSPQLHQRT